MLQRIFNVPVAADQLSLILTTLCYDGVLEPAAGYEEETWRIAGHKIPEDTAFTSFPCGVCPVSYSPSLISMYFRSGKPIIL